MADIEDLKSQPAKSATELLYPADTDGDGQATISKVANPSGRADGSATTGIPHGVDGDDLSPEAIETLGQYLGVWTDKNITKVNPNPQIATPIVSHTQNYADSDQTHHAVVGDPDQGGGFFTPDAYTWTGGVDADGLSVSPVYPPVTPTEQYAQGSHAANTLLRDVEGNSTNGKQLDASTTVNASPGLEQAINSRVLTNNRFMQGEPFNTGENVPNTKSYMLASRPVGNDVGGNVGRYNRDADGADLAELTKMAERILKAAAGEADAETPFDAIMPNTTQWIPGMTSLFPQSMIDTDSLNPTKQLVDGGAPAKLNKSDVGAPLPSTNVKSYGTLNHPHEPFGGLPLGMMVVAIVSAIAIAVIALVTALLMDVLLGWWAMPQKKSGPPDPTGLPLGRAVGSNAYGNYSIGETIWKWMGLPILNGQYKRVWSRLFEACFQGLSTFWVPRIFFSPGYYAVVHRNALRDLMQVEVAIGQMAKGEIDKIAGLFLIIESFTTSATFRFMTTICALGDIIRQKGGPGDRVVSSFAATPILWEQSLVAPSLQTLNQRSRLSVGSSLRADRMSALPTTYIRPYVDASAKLVGLDLTDATPGKFGGEGYTDVPGEPWQNSFKNFDPVTGRIPTEWRERIEDMLDTYYVPFYFHDMRTNEIVPLPCFVENISDNYSPEYDAVKGFGRLDPVQIYKGTTRKVGMSFWVAAQDREDFETMWLAINRLVTMVYPQWSVGDIRTTETGGKFVMPFSSVMTSSPLIRIRLGDLFASNVSTTAIQRLFGVGVKDHFEMVPDPGVPGITSLAVNKYGIADPGTALELYQKSLKGAQVGSVLGWDPFNVALTGLMNAGGDITDAFIPFNFVTNALQPGTRVRINGWSPVYWAKWDGLKFVIVKSDPPLQLLNLSRAPCYIANYACDPIIIQTDIDGDPTGIKTNPSTNFFYVVRPVDDVFPIPKDADGNEYAGIAVPQGEPIATYDQEASLAYFTTLLKETQPDELNAEFFDPKFNVITKTFQESGGRGLAGVITSLDIDWNAGTWETDLPGRRAPQFAKITIGFAPIHDIPPGLASDGSVRAPLYPVAQHALHGEPYNVPGKETIRDRMNARQQALKEQIAEMPATEGEGIE